MRNQILYLLLSACFVGVMLLGGCHAQQRVTLGSVSFVPPVGWTSSQGGTTYAAGNLPKGQVAMLAFAPEQACSGVLESCLQTAMDAMKQKYGASASFGALTAKSFGAGGKRLETAGIVSKDNVQFRTVLDVVGIGRTVVPLILMTNVEDKKTLEGIGAVGDRLIASLQLTPGGAAKVMQGPVGVEGHAGITNGSTGTQWASEKGVAGIWEGVGPTYLVGSYTPHMDYTWITFFSDGTFLDGFPNGGLDGFDMAMQQRVFQRGLWGRYQVSGRAGSITVGKDTFPLQFNSDGSLLFERVTYRKLSPCDGLRLNGSYRRKDWRTLTGISKNPISFTSDGRFTDEGVAIAANLFEYDARGKQLNEDGRPGSGMYVIRQNTLTLHYSDGRRRVIPFFIHASAKPGDLHEVEFSTYEFDLQ